PFCILSIPRSQTARWEGKVCHISTSYASIVCIYYTTLGSVSSLAVISGQALPPNRTTPSNILVFIKGLNFHSLYIHLVHPLFHRHIIDFVGRSSKMAGIGCRTARHHIVRN